MAGTQNKLLSKGIIATDRAALLSLKNMTDYVPTNPALSIATVVAHEEHLRETEATEILAKKALAVARSARIAAGWALHNAMLGVKDCVSGQYGSNSNAVQALGLKKKNDYKRPKRRKAPPEEPSS